MEVTQTLYMGFSGILFALGGTINKAFRRFGLPAVTVGYLFLAKTSHWQILGVSIGLLIALHLGYGETKPWFYKALVGVAFIAPTFFLGITLWQIITPTTFLVLFLLSNWKKTQKDFFWKACEFLIGVLISITIISAKGA